MANTTYATIDDLYAVLDRRTALELSGDDNQHEGQPQTIQALLNMSASGADSVLQGRYGNTPLTGTIPPMLTWYVVAKTVGRLYQRRGTVPDGVADEMKRADEWLQALAENRVALPGISRTAQPALQDSNYTDGRSQWDWIFDQSPSKTGPSGGL